MLVARFGRAQPISMARLPWPWGKPGRRSP